LQFYQARISIKRKSTLIEGNWAWWGGISTRNWSGGPPTIVTMYMIDAKLEIVINHSILRILQKFKMDKNKNNCKLYSIS
jgi:hypothetical protein